jgi:NAD(P)-dependent dehydrogenase (short-subunit alcohol dehydrogenase family)
VTPDDHRPVGTAVVTGGTRGLGRALVLAFARRGFRVYATARGTEALAALTSDTQVTGLDVVPLQADVASVEDNARVARRIADDGRRLDVLVHNAALLGPRTELAAHPPEVFQQVMLANVFGPFDLTRQLLSVLQRGAAIEFVSSGVTGRPRTRWGVYQVSKVALEAMAGIWAKELADRGVRVFVVDPGPMRTEMRARAYPQEDPATLAPPEERTAAFVWLAERADIALSGQRFQAEGFVPPG